MNDVDADAVRGRGAAIKERREGYGWNAKAFAARADISRDTLAAVEADVPTVRPATYAKVELALDALAEEIGDDGPGRAESLEVTMRDVYGVGELIVKGPPSDPDALAQAVGKILDQIRSRSQ